MSAKTEETNTPKAAAESAPATPTNPIERAKAMLEGSFTSAPAAPEAGAASPAEAGTPPAEDAPTAADLLLAGQPLQAPAAGAAEDPSVNQLLTLHQSAMEQRAQLDAQRRELDAQRAQMEAALNIHKAIEAKDYGAMLAAAGLSYEDLTAAMLAGGPNAQQGSVSVQLEQLQKQLEEMPKQYEAKIQQMQQDAAAAQAAQKRAQWDAETTALATGNPKYELLTSDLGQMALNGKPLATAVYELMERVWTETGGEKDGQVLTQDQALDMLQSAVEKRLRATSVPASAQKILSLTASLSPDNSPASLSAGASNSLDLGAGVSPSEATNLSTALASTTSAGDGQSGPVSDDEYRRRAMEAARSRGM